MAMNMNVLNNSDNIFYEIKSITSEVVEKNKLKLVVNSRDSSGNFWEITFPKLLLESAEILEEKIPQMHSMFEKQTYLTSMTLKLYPDETEHNALVILKDKTPPKKMTVEEIQKALGYRVEIIAGE